MNKIYKVIWSKVKHCYIVVSELAKNCTKSSKSYSLNSVLENNILLSLCNSAVCSPVFNTNIVVPATATNLNGFKNTDVKSFKITVAAIVKNEAKNVPQWVVSARSCADEIIVVDTGSTDDTVQRFADYGITCYHYDWNDDFAAAKNYMISLCHGDWIVLLDGDEWFREGCDVRKAIAKHHGNPVTKAIIADWICLDTTRNNTVMFSGGAVRAFRNFPEIRYFRKVHENLTIKYENFVFEPDFKLYHTGYSGDVNRSKHERNLRIMRTMFDFDNGKVEYPTDWRYIQDTYAGLGEYQKSLDASDKMLAYGVSDYSAPSWITRFNVLFAMKAPIERMNREFDYCFKTVPSVSGFRFLAAIYYFRNGFVSNALENYIEGIRLLMGPQDSTAMQHTYWRMYLPEASALASAVYLQNKQAEAALYACKVSEQYCGKSLWTDNALRNVHCVLAKDVSFNFVDFPNNFLSILTFAKKAVLTTALASSITVGIFPVSVSAGCIIGGSNHYQAEGYSVLVGGSNNTSLCSYGVIIGGHNHNVNGSYGAIVGGVCNQVFDYEGSILGGCNNHAGLGYWYTVDGTTPIYVRSNNVDIQGDKINHDGTYYQLYSIDGDYATVVGGSSNLATACHSFVGGGHANFAVACHASVVGGEDNVASGVDSSVFGGECNLAQGPSSTVVGGCNNISSSCYSIVVGGKSGTSSACHSAVFGGGFNTASCQGAVTVGGSCNTSNSSHSLVAGGVCNISNGYYSVVIGGSCNSANSGCSVVVGGHCGQTYAGRSVSIGGGITGVSTCSNTAQYSVAIGQNAMTTKNYEVAIGSSCAPVTIGGNMTVIGTNTVTDGTTTKSWSDLLNSSTSSSSGCSSTTGLPGCNNTASGCYSYVSGGCHNTASGNKSSVSGGDHNIASGQTSSITGGYCNTVSGIDASILGGYTNSATCTGASVSGGCLNVASGVKSSVSGGQCNSASGELSWVAGGCCGNAYAIYSSVIGGGTTGVSTSQYTAMGSVAIGRGAITTSNYEVAIGSADAPVTIGGNVTVKGTNTITDGTTTKTWSDVLNASGGTPYTLPAATSSTLGGVKVGSNITNSSGTISLTKANVTTALGYTPPTADTNTHYTTHLYVGSGTAANASTTNGNTKIALVDDSTVRNTLTIKGTGATTVTSDANGVITINSTDNNTTYSVATQSANGLMTAADKKKLDGIATGANAYTLPAATSSALGGVKIGSNITNSDGTISLTKANVTAALGYTPPTTDTNTTYDNMSASELSTGTATTARSISAKIVADYVIGKVSAETTARTSAISSEATTRANADTALGTRIDGTIKALSVSGRTITYTKGDGTTGTITTQDTNTTYSAATSSALGLVKTGANITNSSGTISLTKDNVTAALGYTPPTQDTNTTYAVMSASEASTGTATTARSITAKVLADYVGEKVNDAKNGTITGLSISGKTITYTKGDGSTGTLTTQDNNTTYDNMSASELSIGTATTARSISAKVVSDYVKTKTDDKITGLSVNGKVITYTKGDGTTGTITTQDTNTTYSAATNSALGLVKTGANITNSSGTISLTKDNVVAALGYTPPMTDTNTTYSAATSSNLGLVKTGANITNSSGTISLTKDNVTAALGYTPPTADTNTTYAAMSADELTTGTATTSRTMTAKVVSDYVKAKTDDKITGLSVNGKIITYTKGDGTTGTITTQDTNTTYSAATSSALGLVKTGANITNSSGMISLTKDNVVSALGYTPPTTDTNTTYAAMSTDELTTGTATSSRSITAKVLGDYVKGKTNDKISSLSIDGNVITYTKGDGTTGTITTPNTTYSAGSGLTLSGTTLSVNTNGTATSGNTGVVSGGTLYNAVKNKVQYDSDDKSKISLGGTRGTVLSNLLGTTITADSTNAVTGAQLYAVKQDIAGFATDINKHDETIRALNTSVTSALSSVAASGLLVDTMDASKADASLNNLTEAGKNILKQYASDAVQEYVAAQGLSSPMASVAPIAPSNTNDNTLTVTNAGNGSLHVGEGSYVNGTSSIAIGVGNQVNANNSGAFGDPSIINADESYVLGNDDIINTGATGSFIVGNDGVSDAKGGLLFGSNTTATVHAENGIALGNNAEVSAKNAIALGSGSIADTENTVSIGNENLKRKITNVADGAIAENSHEAITGAQLFVTNQKVQENTEAISNKADADAGNINVSDWSSKLGIGHIEDGDTNLVTGGTVYNAVKEIKDNTLVQSNGNFITIGKNDVSSKIDVTNSNGEGRVITGVMTDIDDATSVANVGYVTQISENIIKATNNAFQRVDTKINKAGANAAAIANLPTPTFEGEEKWAFAAGVGHYQGETAGAVGAFYRPNDNVIARVSGSFGNADEMVGAGVAVSLNKANTPVVSKAQLVRTINAQAERINVQDSQINAQNERINNMELSHKAEIDAVRAENAELKAMIADLAAKIK